MFDKFGVYLAKLLFDLSPREGLGLSSAKPPLVRLGELRSNGGRDRGNGKNRSTELACKGDLDV